MIAIYFIKGLLCINPERGRGAELGFAQLYIFCIRLQMLDPSVGRDHYGNSFDLWGKFLDPRMFIIYIRLYVGAFQFNTHFQTSSQCSRVGSRR